MMSWLIFSFRCGVGERNETPSRHSAVARDLLDTLGDVYGEHTIPKK
jgi:hypothetical protein